MNKPHKHAELIKQWADGAEIEWHCYFSNKWYDASLSPSWDNDTEFRVKPVKKEIELRGTGKAIPNALRGTGKAIPEEKDRV